MNFSTIAASCFDCLTPVGPKSGLADFGSSPIFGSAVGLKTTPPSPVSFRAMSIRSVNVTPESRSASLPASERPPARLSSLFASLVTCSSCECLSCVSATAAWSLRSTSSMSAGALVSCWALSACLSCWPSEVSEPSVSSPPS
eukprot:3848852-Rhodomonas_salina.1